MSDALLTDPSVQQPPPGPVIAPAAAPVATPPPASSAVPEPYYKGWLQADGKLDAKALDRLPEHLSSLKPVLERQGTLDDVLGVLFNAQQLAGKKGLAPLPDSAPQNIKDERKALLDSINGVPKDIAAYGIKKPDGVPDEVWNPKLGENFAKWCQDNSVAPKAAQKLIEINMGSVREQIKAQEEYAAKFFADQDSAFNSAIKLENIPADKAKQLVERGAARLGLDTTQPEVQSLLKNSNARIMALRHAIATGEDKFIDGNAQTGPTTSSLDRANDIIKNKANPDNAAYWDPGHALHKQVKQKVQELFMGASARATR